MIEELMRMVHGRITVLSVTAMEMISLSVASVPTDQNALCVVQKITTGDLQGSKGHTLQYITVRERCKLVRTM